MAWKASDALALDVFLLAERHWRPGHAAIWDQLRRSALSVPLNIAEGHAHGPGKRCRSHFRIAYGSAVETHALIDFLLRLGIPLQSLTGRTGEVRALTYRLWQKSRPTGGPALPS